VEFAGTHSTAAQSEQNAVYAGSPDETTRKLVLHARSNVAYAADHLLWVRDGSLVAQRFDADAYALEGEPLLLVPNIRFAPNWFY
jgi:hypothetical protein